MATNLTKPLNEGKGLNVLRFTVIPSAPFYAVTFLMLEGYYAQDPEIEVIPVTCLDTKMLIDG